MPICAERKRIYEEIVNITNEISKLSLVDELAKVNGPLTKEEATEMVNNAEKENPRLFNTMIRDFILCYRTNGSLRIFGEKDEYFQYDINEINPLCLLVLFMMTYGRITDTDIFCHYYEFIVALKKAGYHKVIPYLSNHYIQNVSMSQNIYRIFSE